MQQDKTWVVLLGAPGAGKGTQAKYISQALGVPIFSTGNLLRQAIEAKSALGELADRYIQDGNLVPDEVVIKLVQERLGDAAYQNGVIFDGFPRTPTQAVALDALLKVDYAISIEVGDELIVERTAGRLICPACQASYHKSYNPPEQEGICTRCGTALTVRKDDRPEVMRERLRIYHKQTEPIKRHYDKQGVLRLIAGEGTIDETKSLIMQALGVLV